MSAPLRDPPDPLDLPTPPGSSLRDTLSQYLVHCIGIGGPDSPQ